MQHVLALCKIIQVYLNLNVVKYIVKYYIQFQFQVNPNLLTECHYARGTNTAPKPSAD